MSVGTDEETWKVIKPYLEKWSAKAPNGEPCVMRMGPGGAGHCACLCWSCSEADLNRRQDDP
jgi:6-phosphogluconate dehydrogenase